MSTIQMKRQVLRKVHHEGISPTFALLLIAYEDKAKRMEAYYWDCDTVPEVRIEKMQQAWNISRQEAESLSRIYQAAKPRRARFDT